MSSIIKQTRDFERSFSKAIDAVQTFKKEVIKLDISDKETKDILKAINTVESDCDSCLSTFKENGRVSAQGNIPKKVFNELKKINNLLAKLDQLPNMQIKIAELLVFFRAIDNHFKLLDAFERSTVEPKRFKVKAVENDPLGAG